jgi:sugar transferase EpsL
MNEQYTKGKFESLQILRGIAASIVVIFHEFGATGLFQYGVYGVDLFFVLSGFIILYIHHADIGVKKALRPFLIKRIIRIFPTYWLVTFAYIVLVTLFGHTISITYMLKSLFLLPQDILPVVGVAWTLQYEFLFYMIFCLLLFNRKVFYPLFGLWGLAIIIFYIFPVNFPILIDQLLNPLNLEFLFGCGIALAVIKNKLNFRWTTSLGLVGIAVSITLQYFNIIQMHRAIAWGIPFSLIILGLVKLESKKQLRLPKILKYVGDASYSIYLTHLITLLILESILKKLSLYALLGQNGVIQLIFCIIAILMGCIYYSMIEKPLLRLTQSWFLNRKREHSKLKSPSYYGYKRLFDFWGSVFLLLLVLPIIMIVAVIAKWKIGSPILFKQQRPGLHGNPFYLYKFRTMTNARDDEGNLLPDDVRLAPFGKFLRKYSLDEFPQLFNVIKGDLSLVGPRPLLMDYLSLYTEEQGKRHSVKPGITGWAQVNGRNGISWEEKFQLDVWYVENQSVLLDFKILVLTFFKVLKSEGIQNDNHATMPIFEGSMKNVRQ